ncbi:MAG TPA: hypothetical protein VMV45_16895, partial [Casimicrobiaceae bacterium]|nr:hypothetical protein [Casimicrobiaceae bacterium]
NLNFAGNAPVTVASGANLSGVGSSGAGFLLVAGSGAVSLTGVNAKMPDATKVTTFVVGGVGSDFSTVGNGTLFVGLDQAPPSAPVRSSAPADVTVGLGTNSALHDATNLFILANGNLTNSGGLDLNGLGPTWAGTHAWWTGSLTNSGTIQESKAGQSIYMELQGKNVIWYNNTSSLQTFTGGVNNSGTIAALDGYVDIRVPKGDMINSGTVLGGNGGVRWQTYNGAVTNSGTLQSKQTGDVYVYAGSGGNNANPHDVMNTGTVISDSGDVDVYSEYGNITNAKGGTISAAQEIYIAPNFFGGSAFGNFDNQGSLLVSGSNGSIYIYNDGPGNQTVGGTVGTTGTGVLTYFSASHNPGPIGSSGGTTKIDTPISVISDFEGISGIFLGAQNIIVNAPLSVTELTPGAGANSMHFFGTSTTTRNSVTINANLVAGSFFTSVANAGTNFTFAPFSQDWVVNGNITATKGGSFGGNADIEFHDLGNFQGPGMLTANRVLLEGYGNFNNPVSNDFLQNGLHVTTFGPDPVVTITARGAGTQAVNLNITGDATVTSGDTVVDTISPTNLFGFGCFNTPLCNYTKEPNAGSSLIVQASGTLTIGPNNYPNALNISGGGGPPDAVSADAFASSSVSGMSASNGFLFPGALAFITPGTLNINTIVDNAYDQTVAPFQGQWYQGSTINAVLPFYTNGNARINFSVLPNGSPIPPAVFTAQLTTDLFGFRHLIPVLTPHSAFLNTYTIVEQAFVHGQNWQALISNAPIN